MQPRAAKAQLRKTASSKLHRQVQTEQKKQLPGLQRVLAPVSAQKIDQKKEHAFIAPESLALHRHFENQPDVNDKQLRTCVQLLKMGMEEGHTKESFYAHAKKVLNPTATPDVTLPALD